MKTEILSSYLSNHEELEITSYGDVMMVTLGKYVMLGVINYNDYRRFEEMIGKTIRHYGKNVHIGKIFAQGKFPMEFNKDRFFIGFMIFHAKTLDVVGETLGEALVSAKCDSVSSEHIEYTVPDQPEITPEWNSERVMEVFSRFVFFH